jgi:predicted DNA-binding transcriptional regulator YafY
MTCEGRVRNKAVGLFALRELLSDGRWHSMNSIAVELGVSPRTAQRWLSDLQEVGVPVAEEMQSTGGGLRPLYAVVQAVLA